MELQLLDVLIRKFRPEDRAALRAISCQTAFLGCAEQFIDDFEILADSLTIYFTDYEPQSSFVATLNGRVVGYLNGGKNAKVVSCVFSLRLCPRIIFKAVVYGLFFKPKFLQFAGHSLLSLFKGEFFMPDFSKDYPAILHINLMEEVRGQGVGSRMLKEYFQYLRENQVPGALVSTMTEEGKRFFESYGFQVLFVSKRSFFRYRLGRDVPLYILGKKL